MEAAEASVKMEPL
ncbi:hypothetical protein E2320_005788, partial [Naja naja]